MTEIQMTSDITVEPINVHANDALVAFSARVSTLGEASMDFDRPIDGLIRRLMRDTHGTPFEHGGSFTFRVTAPRAVMAEHRTHRIGFSYNGESARYRTVQPVFYTPPAERGLTQVGKAMEYDIQPGSDLQRRLVRTDLADVAEMAWQAYEGLLRVGIAREVARFVLPENLMVTYYITFNPRSLMAFLELRGEGTHALWELQQVAKAYEAVFAEVMPITHTAFVENGRIAP